MVPTIKILGPGDDALLRNVARDVFDNEADPDATAEFLNDPRHHLAVAVEEDLIVGMASAVHYIHPDKKPELWINEVGVASTHRRQGIGRKLISALFELGEALGCNECWVLTHQSNKAAMGLYSSVGGLPEAEEPVMFTMKLNPNK